MAPFPHGCCWHLNRHRPPLQTSRMVRCPRCGVGVAVAQCFLSAPTMAFFVTFISLLYRLSLYSGNINEAFDPEQSVKPAKAVEILCSQKCGSYPQETITHNSSTMWLRHLIWIHKRYVYFLDALLVPHWLMLLHPR